MIAVQSPSPAPAQRGCKLSYQGDFSKDLPGGIGSFAVLARLNCSKRTEAQTRFKCGTNMARPSALLQFCKELRRPHRPEPKPKPKPKHGPAREDQTVLRFYWKTLATSMRWHVLQNPERATDRKPIMTKRRQGLPLSSNNLARRRGPPDQLGHQPKR